MNAKAAFPTAHSITDNKGKFNALIFFNGKAIRCIKESQHWYYGGISLFYSQLNYFFEPTQPVRRSENQKWL